MDEINDLNKRIDDALNNGCSEFFATLLNAKATLLVAKAIVEANSK